MSIDYNLKNLVYGEIILEQRHKKQLDCTNAISVPVMVTEEPAEEKKIRQEHKNEEYDAYIKARMLRLENDLAYYKASFEALEKRLKQRTGEDSTVEKELRDRLHKFETKYNSLNERFTNTLKSLDAAQTTNKELVKKVKELEKLSDELSKNQRVINLSVDHQLAQDLMEAYDFIRDLKDENAVIRMINDDLEVKLEEAQNMTTPSDLFEEQNLQLESANEEIKELKELVELSDSFAKESREQISALNAEIKDLKFQIQQLQGKLISSQIQMNSYKERHGARTIIEEGVEVDYYSGEQKDVILEALQEKLKNCEPYTRKYMVLKSIIDANPEDGTRNEYRRRLMELFSHFAGSKYLTNSQLKELSEMGFEVVKGKDHDKMVFKNDERLSISIPTTPKKNRRDGLNQGCDVAKMVF